MLLLMLMLLLLWVLLVLLLLLLLLLLHTRLGYLAEFALRRLAAYVVDHRLGVGDRLRGARNRHRPESR